MSIQAVAWALEQCITDSAAKLVLLSLCNAHNGDTGLCKPTKSRIAAEASVSVETVTRKLKYLVENGWIESIPSFDSTGRQTANTYRLIIEGEGVCVTPRGVSSDMGEGVNCDTPLKKPEDISEVTPLSPPKKKAHLLPEDWVPSQAGLDLAEELDVDAEWELSKFRDYWLSQPNSKARKKDWNRTWNNWVRNSKPSAKKKPQGRTMIEALHRASLQDTPSNP